MTDRVWRVGLLGVALLALSTYVWWSLTGFSTHIAVQGDALVYRAGVNAWLTGQPVYQDKLELALGAGEMYFTYTPLALPLLAPIAVVSISVGAVILTVASVLALWAWARTALKTLAPTSDLPAWAPVVITLVLCITGPMRDHLHIGQVNVFLLLLATLDLTLPKTRWPRGLLLGVAICIKVTPAALLLLPLISRQFRVIVVAGLTTAVGIGVGWLLVPHEAWFYWTKALRDPGRVGNLRRAENQSLRGIAERLLDGPIGGLTWLALCAIVVLVVAFLLHRYFRNKPNDPGAFAITALLPVLLSPVAWTHHWVWAFPLLVWLGYRGWVYRDRISATLAAVGYLTLLAFPVSSFDPASLAPSSPTYSRALALLAGGYTYWALVALGGTAWALARGGGGTAPARAQTGHSSRPSVAARRVQE